MEGPQIMLKRLAIAFLAASLLAPVQGMAQQTDGERNVMVVFDASGSMWGQIEGRAKIEIARDVLSSVLGETTGAMQIGMIAYGHREKGQCSDIETIVPPGPAAMTVPLMVEKANAIKPKGKTPLSDAVRMAAESLKYTENAATVVLVTDGIETCNADPCALANELEQSGVDFTTHVVGFGLSKDEGLQVACLAENTGGKFISADDAEQLKTALNETLSDFEKEEEEPAVTPRNVQLTLRDTTDSDIITIRHLELTPRADNAQSWPQDFQLRYGGAPSSGEGTFLPGKYTVDVRRAGEGRAQDYSASITFTVEPGDGIQVIDLAMAARLKVSALIRSGQPYDPSSPPSGGVKSSGYLYLALYPLVDGKPTEEAIIEDHGGFEIGVPPGRYLLRGTMDRTTTRDREIEVKAGELTEIEFDMDLSSVFLTALQDGMPVTRQTTYVYDKVPEGRNYWRGGYGGVDNPFYVAAGTWVVGLGREGGGKRRSQILLNVPDVATDIRMSVPEGQTLSEADLAVMSGLSYQGCKAYLGVKHTGCLVPFPDQVQAVPEPDPAPDPAPEPEVEPAQPDTRAGGGFGGLQGVSTGLWARIGQRERVDAEALAQACMTNPLMLSRHGSMLSLRRDKTGFAVADSRVCVPHESGELDCRPVGDSSANALLISMVAAGAAPSLCLSGPDGRAGKRICANIQPCDAAALAGLSDNDRKALEGIAQ